jgi:hypothetical protein
MLSHSHLSMTAATLRRIPAQSQRETAEWRERDLCELSPDAQCAVRIGLTHALAALTPRQSHPARRAAKRRAVSAPPPYHLLDLPTVCGL